MKKIQLIKLTQSITIQHNWKDRMLISKLNFPLKEELNKNIFQNLLTRKDQKLQLINNRKKVNLYQKKTSPSIKKHLQKSKMTKIKLIKENKKSKITSSQWFHTQEILQILNFNIFIKNLHHTLMEVPT